MCTLLLSPKEMHSSIMILKVFGWKIVCKLLKINNFALIYFREQYLTRNFI